MCVRDCPVFIILVVMRNGEKIKAKEVEEE